MSPVSQIQIIGEYRHLGWDSRSESFGNKVTDGKDSRQPMSGLKVRTV